MPVPVRETPLGREIYEEAWQEGEKDGRAAGRQEGHREGRQEGRHEGELQTVLRLTRLMLRQRFGDAPQVEVIAERLAELPDEERLTRIASAASLADLDR